jgi:hypothetical protein
VTAVVTTGSIALEQPEPAHAVWEGGLVEWADSLNSTLGKAGGVFGIETAEFDLGMTIIGPIISALFGTPTGPSIRDVLDKLQELDDLKSELAVMQNELVEIHQNVLDVDLKVVMGTCTLQTLTLPSYINDVKIAQAGYSDVLKHVERVRTVGDETSKIGLKTAINNFITKTMGGLNQTDVTGSALGTKIGAVHEQMISTGGRPGAIQSCGAAYYEEWKLHQASAASRSATTEADRGVWLDDRQYYEPLQEFVRYWQSAQAHGVFLLQQATLMQAALQYTTTDKQTLAPENAASVCSSASSTTAPGPIASYICESALDFTSTMHDNFALEWKQVGLPLSNDEVVMSLGTDVTGVTNNGVRMDSLVWARTPSAFPAPWVKGSWSDKATPVSHDGIAGFAPATSSQWNTLLSQYVTSHSTVTPTVQTPVQKLADPGDTQSTTWQTAGVAPFAPFDLLTLMRENRIPDTEARAFDTTGVDMVWIPHETATRNMPAFETTSPYGVHFGSSDKLGFPPSQVTGWATSHADHQWSTETGLAVKCMVAPVDGLLCGDETIASWFVARQKTDWSLTNGAFAVRPSSPVLGDFEVATSKAVRCENYRTGSVYYAHGCDWQFDPGVTKAPIWLAPLTLKNGTTVEGSSSQQTLWPVAPATTGCTTNWGVPSRCLPQIDAWLKANLPDPAFPGPQATSAPVIVAGQAGGVMCPAPAWAAHDAAATGAIESGDVTWTGWSSNGLAYSMTAPKNTEFLPDTLAMKAGWWDPDGALPVPTVTAFGLRCSIDAKFANLASVSTVTSQVASIRYNGTYFTLARAGEDAPDGSTPAEPVVDVAAAPDGSRALAATGGPWAGGFWAASLVLFAGAALTLVVRLRMRRAEP